MRLKSSCEEKATGFVEGMIRKASPDSLIEVLSGLGQPRLLVIGDLILDEYVWGGVERISPEAPIPVLRVSRRDFRLGGAGSVVANLDVLGAEVHMLSILGDDASASTVCDMLERSNCNTDLIARVPGRPTTLKTRHLGFVQHADRAVQQMLRVDTEDVSPAPREVLDVVVEKLRPRIGEFDAILVSDYDKGLLANGLLRSIIDFESDVPVIVDPARLDDYSRYQGAFLACPNRYETALATGERCDTVEACRSAGQKLAELAGFDVVTVTMDREGIYICPKEGPVTHMATEARTVSDVTGAGDMVLSMLGLAIGGGADVETAVKLANVAGGIEVRMLGATPIPREDILRELLFDGFSGAGKLVTASELAGKLAEMRSAGQQVVFTNGCFDLLHFGHHHLLNQARACGDCLVVAINSDASVRRIKGENRPMFSEQRRMLMLSGLESVDYVVVFDEDDPIRLLEQLRPDVLVKGAEYGGGGVVGQELVESWGGRIELIEHVEGISPTSILEGRSGVSLGEDSQSG